MNELNVTTITPASISKDFTVNPETGEAFISQRKLAELLDIPRKTLADRIRTAHPETDTSRGIPGEIANQTAHHYARSGRSGAIEFICKISEAGMKAYIYHEAGMKMKAEPKPMTQNEILLAQAKFMVEQDKINERNEQKQLALEAKAQEIETVQESHEKIITDIKQRQDDMNGDTGYCTALAYCRSKNIPAPLEFAQKLGKSASKLCRNRGIRMGKVSDERFRSVNSYPRGVLDECLAEINAIDHQSQMNFDFED